MTLSVLIFNLNVPTNLVILHLVKPVRTSKGVSLEDSAYVGVYNNGQANNEIYDSTISLTIYS